MVKYFLFVIIITNKIKMAYRTRKYRKHYRKHSRKARHGDRRTRRVGGLAVFGDVSGTSGVGYQEPEDVV